MKTLIGGAIAAVLGLIGVVIWWPHFVAVLGGTIPIVLLLGGALAIYLGFDEMKDDFSSDEPVSSDTGSSEEVEKYKQEINELKEELQTLKKDDSE